MESLKLYIKESYNELVNKVTWPSLSSLQQTTVVVIVASIIFSLIIFVMDGAAKLILNDLIYENFSS
ncbi:MAG: preprotein translocase subunit SecE [Bacteroidetes bacterium]|jgi:preprotein translocase subunit SecE|nr:preprotein translocase subunit SecE [Bacteroidota bacterium]MDF1863921.1 preprotein translocase subunit SecE [Saprospiraceae bacterium]